MRSIDDINQAEKREARLRECAEIEAKCERRIRWAFAFTAVVVLLIIARDLFRAL